MTETAGARVPRVAVLGPVELRGPDGRVPVRSARQRRLLAALALHADRAVDVEVLAELVWDVAPPVDPSGALQTNVARLRRLLPAGVAIETGARSYRLRVGADDLDAVEFQAGLTRAADEPDPSRRVALLDALLALWRGRPFTELDHPALGPEVARLTELHRWAQEQRAAGLLAAGRPGEAVAAAEALVAAEPLREGAVAVLVEALAATGRQGEALAAHARLRDRLDAELGVEPGPELRAVHLRVLRQELPAPRPAPAPTARRTPVRVPVSSFVGRDADLGAVSALLRDGRVVTLCGPGGVGKTRLAVHVAAAIAGRYPDGALVVEFGGGGPADVAAALAAALGLSDLRAGSPAELVVDGLAVRHQLLVLDNCEHVADEVAAVVEAVVAGAPAVDVLATSREPLRVDGEQVHAVAPLDGAAAARLLADRLRAGDPAAVPGPGQAALVEQVCRRLDGLPLAVELAAGRAVHVGLAGLVEALEHPHALDVLRGGRRTAAPRHRSLRDVVDWSYGLLDDRQRTLFDRMSVFAGPVERAAVRAVCEEHDGLADLVERSLVVRHPGEPARFGMLETLRAYGRAHLATDPGTPRLRARHADWAVGLAEEVRAGRRGPGEAAAVRRFEAHLADLNRAHDWLCANGPRPQLLRLTLLFAELAYLRGRVDLTRVLDRTLDVVDDPGAAVDPLVPRLLGLSASVRWMHGELDLAAEQAHRALELAARTDDPTSARDAHESLANVASFRGELGAALEHARAALELDERVDDQEGRVVALTDLTIICAYAADGPAAAHYEERLVAAADRLGSPTARAWSHYARGERRAEAGEPGAAAHLAAAVRAAEEVGSGFIAGVARHTLLTSAARGSTDPASALAGFGPLIDHWHGFGAWSQLWIAIRALVETLSRLDRHAEAALLLAALRASRRASPVFGSDAARLDAVDRAARATLGTDFDALAEYGAALGDTAAVAAARRAARNTSPGAR
ncbi:ATP-binding protein [Pseudonocardia humida]|uniref:Winged helix-turn-helix domain-containing protein n=1 Tax=Pseudonocardia humida TaxID=2800819 RepID=A0ABT1A4C8_9PSEU|nr:BTAD domain-containing putative transcriptional regulator [Pseudonocardia humida]MCO1657840.1 winged helix-turn-helix domain-containing protein [Pseudonocardia humida]